VSTPRATIVLATLLAAACGDATGPAASAIEVVSGDAQAGMRGWQLERPISVVVRDAAGKVLPGVPVQFDAMPGSGSALPASVETDASGTASTRWRLGASALGPQTLTVSSGASTVEAHATALPPDEGDLLVVHGALGPLRGVALTATFNTLESPMGATPSDTVIPIPPMDAPGRGLVVLSHERRTSLTEPAWTSGPDTVHVQLEPPIEIEIAFTILDGTFAVRVAELESQIQRMEEAWSEAGAGIRVGNATFVDETGTGPADRFSPGFCGSPALVDRLEVAVLTSIDLGVYWGYSCPNGYSFITGPNLSDPQGLYLLAHEVGHLFGLGHRVEGVMKPNGTEGSMTMGEAFIMNFASYSGLNTVFAGQPSSAHRNCVSAYPGECLDQDYDLPEE
jgi:hypothetical protein